MNYQTDYNDLCSNLKTLTDGIPHKISNLANAAALIYNTMDGLNWSGFYLLIDNKLILGPFQGKPACIEILPGHGVCGSAVLLDQTVVVKNVHEFPGHIACDDASNSEIVIPIHKDGQIIGVLDLDSPEFGRFTDTDKSGLELFVSILEKTL